MLVHGRGAPALGHRRGGADRRVRPGPRRAAPARAVGGGGGGARGDPAADLALAAAVGGQRALQRRGLPRQQVQRQAARRPDVAVLLRPALVHGAEARPRLRLPAGRRRAVADRHVRGPRGHVPDVGLRPRAVRRHRRPARGCGPPRSCTSTSCGARGRTSSCSPTSVLAQLALLHTASYRALTGRAGPAHHRALPPAADADPRASRSRGSSACCRGVRAATRPEGCSGSRSSCRCRGSA